MNIKFRNAVAVAALVGTALVAGACQTDPEVARKAYMASGDGYFEQKKYDEAVIQYRNAVQKAPRSGESRLKLAETYALAADVPNAYREYIRAADLLPDRIDVQIKAITLMMMAGQFEDAKTRVQQILQKDPKNLEALKVGDMVDITYAQALAVTLDKSAK